MNKICIRQYRVPGYNVILRRNPRKTRLARCNAEFKPRIRTGPISKFQNPPRNGTKAFGGKTGTILHFRSAGNTHRYLIFRQRELYDFLQLPPQSHCISVALHLCSIYRLPPGRIYRATYGGGELLRRFGAGALPDAMKG